MPIQCIPAPSDDHTYCYTQSQIAPQAVSPGSSIDEAYDFGAADDVDDEWFGREERRTKKGSDFDRSHSDIECSDSSNTDFDEGGSDGEQRSRVRGLIVKLPLPKRKRKSLSPVPLLKRRVIDPDEEHKKIVAGADALLNLASAALALQDYTPTHSNTPTNTNNTPTNTNNAPATNSNTNNTPTNSNNNNTPTNSNNNDTDTNSNNNNIDKSPVDSSNNTGEGES